MYTYSDAKITSYEQEQYKNITKNLCTSDEQKSQKNITVAINKIFLAVTMIR